MIYVFLAAGFEEVEALTPVDLLRRAGKTVQTVGIGGKEITGARGITVTADLTDTEMQLDDSLEMIVLPGGMPGTLNLKASDAVQAALRFMDGKQRPIAAICAAPTVLGAAGLLKGRNAVCYPGMEEGLTGANAGTDAVCTDGHITTSRGAGTAMDFALELIRVLCGAQKSDEIAKSVVYLK